MQYLIRVWDMPTRLFHWLLALCIPALFVTAKLQLMSWHFRFAYATLILLLFRLAWGFLGGHWSRFRAFFYSPRTVLAFLRGDGAPTMAVGHSPTGSWSVLAMLFFLTLQVLTGLVSDDEIASMGPFSSMAPSAVVARATWYHTHLGQYLLLALLTLHVLAILYYELHKRLPLVRAMLSGDKVLGFVAPGSRDDRRSRLTALATLLVAGCAVGLLLWLAPG